jgi:endo-beta-N-acetylglucosaminidase D
MLGYTFEGDEGLNGIKGRFFALEDDVDSDSDLDSVRMAQILKTWTWMMMRRQR